MRFPSGHGKKCLFSQAEAKAQVTSTLPGAPCEVGRSQAHLRAQNPQKHAGQRQGSTDLESACGTVSL